MTYVRAANLLYRKLDYERALEQLAKAKDAAKGIEEDALVAVWQGVIYVELNRLEDARSAFSAAFALQPEAKLPLKVSPKVAQEFETTRAQVKNQLAKLEPSAAPAVKPTAEPVAPVTAGPKEVAATPAPSSAPIAPAPRVVEVTPAPTLTPVVEPEVSQPLPTRKVGMRQLAWAPLALGAAGVVTGVVCALLSNGQRALLEDRTGPRLTWEDTQAIAGRGQALQVTAIIGFGVGAAGLATGLIAYAFGGPSDDGASLGFAATADGAAVTFGARW
jgi:tetratricopeptide (TPR) repeat protein